MYVITSMSYDELGTLIREKRVTLNNAELLFGDQDDDVDEYMRECVGYKGYTLGIRGRLNPVTAEVMSAVDSRVLSRGTVILEAQVPDEEVIQFNLEELGNLKLLLDYGFDKDSLWEQLDLARETQSPDGSVEILCVPFISIKWRIRVTALVDNLEFSTQDIEFVKVRGTAG